MALSVHLRSYVCDFIFLGGLYMSEGLDLCSSAKMQPIRDLIAKVAATNTTLLLRGESGVGKEVDRKSTRLNSSHGYISYAVFCLKKKKTNTTSSPRSTLRP